MDIKYKQLHQLNRKKYWYIGNNTIFNSMERTVASRIHSQVYCKCFNLLLSTIHFNFMTAIDSYFFNQFDQH